MLQQYFYPYKSNARLLQNTIISSVSVYERTFLHYLLHAFAIIVMTSVNVWFEQDCTIQTDDTERENKKPKKHNKANYSDE